MHAVLSAPGVVGAREAGAGFGGCPVAFAEARSVEAFAEQVVKRYRAETGIDPEVYPAEASQGAGVLGSSR